MSLSIAEWHQRYQQQAGWTREIRRQVFSFPWFKSAQKIIELGCGTGVVLEELISYNKLCIVGLDIDREPLKFGVSINPSLILTQANAYKTPFASSTFDICFCHYLLLWIKNPKHIIDEMVRITRPGGWIVAFAEPDYGGRIDYPFELDIMAKAQTQSLIHQGADPFIGRKLKSLFIKSGMIEITCGILGAQWSIYEDTDISLELDVLSSDINLLKNHTDTITMDQIQPLQQLDRQSWKDQTRILFVPTFYAWGKVNKPDF